MGQIRLAVLANENKDDHLNWCRALDNRGNIDYDIICLSGSDWFERIANVKYDYLLAKPPGLTATYKQLYDERIFLIDNILELPVYPTPEEIYIYENKRFFYSWLKANDLPHPKAYIYYCKNEVLKFVENYEPPLVAKHNIGASSSGVHILKSKTDKLKYINEAFTSGAPKRWGPNFERGGIIKRGLNYLKNPGMIKGKLDVYNKIRTDVQKGFVILQDYIEHEYEWRIVAIGESYFAHKKLKVGDKASGSLLKNYDNPPLYLFDFVRNIMERFGLTSQAVDVFETMNGELLINEMQCMFGQSDPYQMLVDNKPGRYRYLNNKWVFEEGDFARNECFDLRVEHILSRLRNQK
ncbi:MAG: hypothetical protein AB1432_04410 [Bacteroidota bacterium]